MKIRRCTVCLLFKPQSDAYFVRSAHRKWSSVCILCSSAKAAAAPKRKHRAVVRTDERDRRHPLEEVIRAWVTT